LFTSKELKSINRKYFIIHDLSPTTIVIQSRNSRHYWKLHSQYEPTSKCKILHSHHGDHDYHEHGKAGSLANAIHQICAHDSYQLTYRKPETHYLDDYAYPILPNSEYFVF